jgi:ribosomal protein S18 acetylase RimI-like enzyme
VTEISIRRATLADLDEITRLYIVLKEHHVRLLPSSPRYQVPDDGWRVVAEKSLRDPGSAAFVALSSEQTVGFMKLSFVEKPWGLSCELDTMVVDPHHRSRGIGSCLLRQAERCASERGAKGMRADVLIDNYEARRFYERDGFEPTSVRYARPVREQD